MAKTTESKTAQPPIKELKSKLTIANICHNGIPKPDKDSGETVPIARIVGKAVDCKVSDKGNYGPSIYFIGEFVGIEVSTGNQIRASKMYLPAIAEGMVEAGLKSSLIDNDQGHFEFAFDVSVRYGDNKAGYEFVVESLVENPNADPLAQILDSISKDLPALTAK
jgi:hypothetical protein